MKLVIAEKPSVGAAIAAVLCANEKRSGYFEGSGYLVSWCIGHLISLADAAKGSSSLDDLDFDEDDEETEVVETEQTEQEDDNL